MLNMMEAFSKAKEYWEVGLCVNASNLRERLAACQRGPRHASFINAPCKRDLDVLFVDGEAQVEQFKLAIVSVEQIPPSGAVFPGTPHVLPEAVQGGAFLSISLGIVAIGVLYVVFQRMYPVDLVGGLERHRYHGNLGHFARWQTGDRGIQRGGVVEARSQRPKLAAREDGAGRPSEVVKRAFSPRCERKEVLSSIS